MTLQRLNQVQQRDERIKVTTEWVCIRPTFLPPVNQHDAGLDAKGIGEDVYANGRRFRCWLQRDSIDTLTMRTALVKMSPIQPSDQMATFDFAAYLHSQGVMVRAEVLTWGDIVQGSFLDRRVVMLSHAWRAGLHKKFRGEGAPLIWSVFGEDKSALTTAHRSSFQQLRIAHLFGGQRISCGIEAGDRRLWFTGLVCCAPKSRMCACCGCTGLGRSSELVLLERFRGLPKQTMDPTAFRSLGPSQCLQCQNSIRPLFGQPQFNFNKLVST